jgi:acyl phosphate:glycerol-3-phosphate acyltransferase
MLPQIVYDYALGTIGMIVCLLILVAYLLGAIPFGLLIGYARGVDIRQHGSRNIGATNAGRVLGRKWGYVCLLLDVGKGFAPVLVAGHLLVQGPLDALVLLEWLAVGVAAVLGHTFPVYLRFKGGKGVATTVGVALGIYPFFTWPMVVALLAFAAVRFGTGVVSAGSLTIAVVFPTAVYVYAAHVHAPRLAMSVYWPLLTVAGLLGSLIILRHRANIVRLVRREELSVAPPDRPPNPDEDPLTQSLR